MIIDLDGDLKEAVHIRFNEIYPWRKAVDGTFDVEYYKQLLITKRIPPNAKVSIKSKDKRAAYALYWLLELMGLPKPTVGVTIAPKQQANPNQWIYRVRLDRLATLDELEWIEKRKPASVIVIHIGTAKPIPSARTTTLDELNQLLAGLDDKHRVIITGDDSLDACTAYYIARNSLQSKSIAVLPEDTAKA